MYKIKNGLKLITKKRIRKENETKYDMMELTSDSVLKGLKKLTLRYLNNVVFKKL